MFTLKNKWPSTREFGAYRIREHTCTRSIGRGKAHGKDSGGIRVRMSVIYFDVILEYNNRRCTNYET